MKTGSGISRPRFSPIAGALQQYADRGVFRGFSMERGTRGRERYQFAWLTRQPTTAVFDPVRATLSFPGLMPGVRRGSVVARALTAIVEARMGRVGIPAHKRIDRRRALVSCAAGARGFSLEMSLRGRQHEYVVRHALNLINDLFLQLHEAHPEYLIEHFGMSSE
jgi:hypothetical protein